MYYNDPSGYAPTWGRNAMNFTLPNGKYFVRILFYRQDTKTKTLIASYNGATKSFDVSSLNSAYNRNYGCGDNNSCGEFVFCDNINGQISFYTSSGGEYFGLCVMVIPYQNYEGLTPDNIVSGVKINNIEGVMVSENAFDFLAVVSTEEGNNRQNYMITSNNNITYAANQLPYNTTVTASKNITQISGHSNSPNSKPSSATVNYTGGSYSGASTSPVNIPGINSNTISYFKNIANSAIGDSFIIKLINN